MTKVFRYSKNIVSVLFMLLFLCESLLAQIKDIPSDVQFLYYAGKGKEVIVEGDKTGTEIRVLFSGKLNVYTTVFKGKPILKETGKLSEANIDSLKKHFAGIGFTKLPFILPRTNKIIGPAPGCLIGFRENEKKEMKFVYVTLLQKKEYYPEGFLKFRSKIERIFFSYKRKKRSGRK